MRRKITIVIGTIVLATVIVQLNYNFQAFDNTGEKIYVATTGSDSNDGSLSSPLATLAQAQIKERSLKSGGFTGPITIYLRGGRYFLNNPLSLTSTDSGTSGNPVTFASYPGEQAVITGSKTVSGFQGVSDSTILNRLSGSAQNAVRFINLPSLGINDYGSLSRRGGFLPDQNAGLELFFNADRMQLARYPNSGFDSVTSPTTSNSFGYTDSRPASWANYNDVWVHGYFKYDWADSHLKIASVNTGTKVITVDTGFDKYGVAAGQWFYYENVLEELDSPGEWYLDRSTGNLYFWPPSDPTQATVTVTQSNNLLAVANANYLSFDRISFEGTRAAAITATSSTYLKFTNDSFLDIGNDALTLNSVTNSFVATSTFNQLSQRAVYISGGDRTTLTSSNDVVINSTVHDVSQWVRTAAAPIELYGVGTRIAHNEFYNLPQDAIRFHGNDFVIEYNNIHNAVNETLDSGAIYSGRDYTYRGNVIRNNKFKDIGGFQGSVANAVYLDDALSGNTITGNFFDNAGRVIEMGGGRDNTFDNNVIVNSSIPIHFDARGLEWMANSYYNALTNATNSSPIIITISQPHNIHANTAPATLTVSGVLGNTAANGTWNYSIVTPSQISLTGSTGNGTYTTIGGAGSVGNSTGDVISTTDFYDELNIARNYAGSPYNKYTTLFNYTKYTLGQPTNDVFSHNIIYMGSRADTNWNEMDSTSPSYFNFTNGDVFGSNQSVSGSNSTADPKFVNPGGGDYHLQSNSPALGLGFQELPYEWMGPLTSDQLLTAPTNLAATTGQTVEETVNAPYFASSQSQNSVFSVTGLPSGAAFDQNTKKVSWTPSADQVGSYPITISVFDDFLSAQAQFTVLVSASSNGGGGDTGGGSSGGNGNSGQTNSSTDFVLPPVQNRVKVDTNSATAQTSNTSQPLLQKATRTIQGYVLDPLSGRGTPRATGLLIGFLSVVVMPLTAAVTIVIIHRRS